MAHQIIDFCAQNWLQIIQTLCELISIAITVVDKFRTTKSTLHIQTPRNPKKRRKAAHHAKLGITFMFDIHIIR